jgi:hypothetical protein
VHWPESHVKVVHAEPVAQSLSMMHCTQLPSAEHMRPPLVLHMDLAACAEELKAQAPGEWLPCAPRWIEAEIALLRAEGEPIGAEPVSTSTSHSENRS